MFSEVEILQELVDCQNVWTDPIGYDARLFQRVLRHKQRRLEYMKKWRSIPENRLRENASNKKRQERYKSLKNQWQKDYYHKHKNDPEWVSKRKLRQDKFNKTEKRKAWNKAYYKTEAYRQRRREYAKRKRENAKQCT